MKIIYTGTPAELLPKQRAKVEAKLEKIVKTIERKGEKDVHIILSKVRHLHKAEITLNAYDHTLVGEGSDGDFFTALTTAAEKLENQIRKMSAKWRDTHRDPTAKLAPPAEAPNAPAGKTAAAKKKTAKAPPVKAGADTKVFRVNHQDGRKPMTLEEAMLEIGNGQDYLVYTDAKTDRVCTLLRRGDGHLDLIES